MLAYVKRQSGEVTLHTVCSPLSFGDDHGRQADRQELLELELQIAEPDGSERTGKRADFRARFAGRQDFRWTGRRQLQVIGSTEATGVEHGRVTPARWRAGGRGLRITRHALKPPGQDGALLVAGETHTPGLLILHCDDIV